MLIGIVMLSMKTDSAKHVWLEQTLLKPYQIILKDFIGKHVDTGCSKITRKTEMLEMVSWGLNF